MDTPDFNSMPSKPPIIIVLAAGRSTRFRAQGGVGNKLDAAIGLLGVKEHVLQSVRDSGLAHVTVEPTHLAHLSNPGMGDSIANGVARSVKAALRSGNDTGNDQLPGGWLILPADLPLIQSATLQLAAKSLIRAQEMQTATGGDAHPMQQRVTIAPVYQGQRGHPVCFSRGFLQQLLALTGDEGARALLQEHPPELVEVDDIGCVLDVDTPQLLDEAKAVWLKRQQTR